MTADRIENRFAEGAGIAAALRAMPEKSVPEGRWRRVLDRHEDQRRLEARRRRYWGGGAAVAAGIAAAVIGLRLGAGFFGEAGVETDFGTPGLDAIAARGSSPAAGTAGGVVADLRQPLEQMDMDALFALSQFQEQRLRSLPLFDPAGRGQVVEVGSFGIATELEDQIALLDEGLIPASLNAGDQAVPRRLLQERALLMQDLFDVRRAEAAQAGYIYADF